MKRLHLFVLLAVFWAFNGGLCASDEPIAKGHKKHPITEIPVGGLHITSPGTYVVENNLSWSPTGDGQAILITADDVVLDFKDHTLVSDTTSYSTIGILATAAANLVIKDGTIANMGLGGIKCEQCIGVTIKKVTIDGLNMDNTVTYTVPVGILVTSSINALIEKCSVQNINVKTGSLAAIQLTETISSKVIDCHVANLLNRDGACTGIGHLLCDDALVKSCTIDNLKSEFIDNLNTEGHTTIGIVPVASTNLVIKKCKVSNITGCCDDAHGMSIFECIGALVKKCKVENVLDGDGAAQTGAKATGIEVYASGVAVIKCSAKNIKAINPQDKQATGFSCAQCLGVKFLKCTAENVSVVDENGQENPNLGYGTGFGWAPDPRPEFIAPAVDIFYNKCTAKNCQVGFDSWYHIDSLWRDIHSHCNQIPVLYQSGPRTLSCDPCSECGCLQTGCYPTPHTVTLDDIASNNRFVRVKTKTCKGLGLVDADEDQQ